MSGIKIGKRRTHHFLELFLLAIAMPIFDSYKFEFFGGNSETQLCPEKTITTLQVNTVANLSETRPHNHHINLSSVYSLVLIFSVFYTFETKLS